MTVNEKKQKIIADLIQMLTDKEVTPSPIFQPNLRDQVKAFNAFYLVRLDSLLEEHEEKLSEINAHRKEVLGHLYSGD